MFVCCISFTTMTKLNVRSMRSLAHELMHLLQPQQLCLAPNRLSTRLTQALNARPATTEINREEDVLLLSVRTERPGLARRYTEYLDLHVREGELEMTMRRYVNDVDGGYYGGGWHYRENLQNGQASCGFATA